MGNGLPRQSADWLAMTETNVFPTAEDLTRWWVFIWRTMCAATRGIIFRPPGSLFWLLICLATSERPPISDFLFRWGRGLESVGPAKLFDRFRGIFPGKTWGKHLLQRPPTGAKFRQLRLFPYHLKSAGVTSVPVQLRLAAPRRKHAAPFPFRGFGTGERIFQRRCPRGGRRNHKTRP